jgi:hypothetical protein
VQLADILAIGTLGTRFAQSADMQS